MLTVFTARHRSAGLAPFGAGRGTRARAKIFGALAGLGLVAASPAATPLVSINATTYQTEHCLFVIDAAIPWNSPAAAYAAIYTPNATTWPNLENYFATLTTQFPGNYFSICYLANTHAGSVPNYITRIFKATGIATPGTPGAAQSFATVDFCRYNMDDVNVLQTTLGVFDHEIGHAWGARVLTGPGAPKISNGHWLPNSTVDCQLSATVSHDNSVSVDKIYHDSSTGGFRWHRVNNTRDNDYSTFAEQTLYLMGLRAKWRTAYALNNPVYNADGTMGYTSFDTADQAALVANNGPRNPDYKSAQRRFKIGFVYIARDVAEVNTVYQYVEKAAAQFCSADAIDRVAYQSQVPFLCDTKFSASADGLLADLDGNHSPTLSVANSYVTSADGTATINFTAADPDGPAPTVTIVPASTCASIVGSTVQISGLPDGAHFFSLKAADAGGKVTYDHFVVEVQRPTGTVAIVSPPLDQTVTAGANASFSVAATGTPATFTYSWYRQATRTSTWNLLSDGGAISGATTATLFVAADTTMDGDQFLCLVSNGTDAATSASATLVVDETPPTLTTQPADKFVSTGNTVFFNAVPAAPPSSLLTFGYFTYQWQRLAAGTATWADLANGSGITGSTTASLGVLTTFAMSGDQFRCIISNTAGTTTSNIAALTVYLLPSVTTQPVNTSAGPGGTVSFTIVAAGSPPLTYQWLKFATPVAGATGATLTLTNIQAADAGSYGCKVTNPAGFTMSNYASLTYTGVVIAPSITTHPQPQTVTVGSAATFTVAATGTPPFTYQWFKNFQLIPGATLSSYSIASAQSSDAGSFLVQVHNSAGTTQSNSATLTVNLNAQTITFGALPNVGYTPAPIALAATASSTLAVSFSVLSGPATLSGSNLTLTGVGTVTVRATQAGNATFAAAAPVDVAFTVSADFALWQQNNFTAAELASSAQSGSNAIYGVDGYTNLVKYALGLAPTQNVVSGLPQTSAQGANWLFTFSKPTSVSDVACTVEASTDLANWSTASVTQSLVASAGGTDSWQAAYPLASAANIFFRLRVDAPAPTNATSYSPALGGMTITVASGLTQSVALPLLHGSAGSGQLLGRIDAIGANTVDVNTAAWTPGAFSTAANPYYLRFLSGAAAGRGFMVTATANTATQLSVNNDGTNLTQLGIAPGDAYELILADTFGSLFGSNLLVGGTSATTADNVRVWSGASWLTFYFNVARLRWERDTDIAASPARDTFVLRPDRGLMVTRRAALPLTFYIFGRVPEIAPVMFHALPGNTFLSAGLPVGLTLATLGAQSLPGWQAGSLATAATSADLMQTWSGASWLTFFYDSSAGFWRRTTDLAGSPSRNAFTVVAGRPVMIRRVIGGATATDNHFVVPLTYPVTK